jgi:hypothetical protein
MSVASGMEKQEWKAGDGTEMEVRGEQWTGVERQEWNERRAMDGS